MQIWSFCLFVSSFEFHFSWFVCWWWQIWHHSRSYAKSLMQKEIHIFNRGAQQMSWSQQNLFFIHVSFFKFAVWVLSMGFSPKIKLNVCRSALEISILLVMKKGSTDREHNFANERKHFQCYFLCIYQTQTLCTQPWGFACLFASWAQTVLVFVCNNKSFPSFWELNSSKNKQQKSNN